MQPIPILVSSPTVHRNLLCSRRLTALDCVLFCFCAFSIVLYFSDLSSPVNNNSETWKESVPSTTIPTSPTKLVDINFNNPSLSSLQADLLRYYQGQDVSTAFFSRNTEMMERVVKRMKAKQDSRFPFVIGQISNGDLSMGNCDSDVYLNLVQHNMGPVFSRFLHVPLEIRDVSLPHSHSFVSLKNCLHTHVGHDVDLVLFSFPHLTANGSQLTELVHRSDVPVLFVQATCHQKQQRKSVLDAIGWRSPWSDFLCLEESLQALFGESKTTWGTSGNPMHSETRLSKKSLVWRNWIPGPLGHQLLADALSMMLIKALLQHNENKPFLSIHTAVEPFMDLCSSAQQPRFGNHSQLVVQHTTARWSVLRGEKTLQFDEAETCIDNDAVQSSVQGNAGGAEGYWEARGEYAGSLVFSLPPVDVVRQVFVCCCCSPLCVEEQLRQPGVRFQLDTDIILEVKEKRDQECVVVAALLPRQELTQFTISISTRNVNIPVRISRVFLD